MSDNNRETCTMYKKEIHITTFFWPVDLSLLQKQNEDELDYSKVRLKQHISFLLKLESGESLLVKGDVNWFLHPNEDLAFFDLEVFAMFCCFLQFSNKYVCNILLEWGVFYNWYLIEYFYVSVHQWNWPVSLFLW